MIHHPPSLRADGNGLAPRLPENIPLSVVDGGPRCLLQELVSGWALILDVKEPIAPPPEIQTVALGEGGDYFSPVLASRVCSADHPYAEQYRGEARSPS